MVKHFRHKGLEKLFADGSKAGIDATMAGKLSLILTALNAAAAPGDVSAPAFRLHPLKGDRAGFWAVTVRANWRVTFRFEGSDVTEVDLIDYHQREAAMPMKNPVHPGRLLREGYLNELELSVTEAARVLGVARQTLNNLVNEKGGVSAEMAIRLSKAFGSSPEFWMRLQFNYDLAAALRKEKKIKVERYEKPAA